MWRDNGCEALGTEIMCVLGCFPPNYLPLLGTRIKSPLAPSSVNPPPGLPSSTSYLGGTLPFKEIATKALFAEKIVRCREILVSTGYRKV